MSGSWTGPRVEVVETGGFSRLRIDGDLVVPLFFAANTQGNLQDDWAAFDYQLDLAARFGVPIVSITMRNGWEYSASNPLSEQTREVFQWVLDRHPGALILPRVFVHHPAAESVVLADLDGKEKQHAFNSISETWILERSTALAALMAHLDAEFPSRILGVHLAYLETGEWFYPGAFEQRFADYSAAARAGFCDYLGLVGGHARCQLPAPALRNSPSVGNVFLEATDADALRSVRFNQYLSQNVARAIGTLAASVKRVSERKALTVAFYGYTFALGYPPAWLRSPRARRVARPSRPRRGRGPVPVRGRCPPAGRRHAASRSGRQPGPPQQAMDPRG